METARSYGDGCGIALGLDLVGERWALLVVRELLLGPLRFTDLRAGLPSASPNVLSQRLRELERAGLVVRRRLPPPAAAWVYALSPSGMALGPVLTALGTWALRSGASSDGPVSAVSAMLAVRTYWRDGPPVGEVEVRLGERVYAVVDGRVTAGPGNAPVAVVTTDPATLVAALGREDGVTAPGLRAEGDLGAVVALFTRVRLPASDPAPT
ncbi:helix-turn-helix domain-containing protein [Actinoplanes sp. NPDC051411]|uniref:winged helix-turn-helix transcriptional regulator n=1 Tax=Actinoplanes sp. NPDC051411 TaxID=3155522 RepID=UPI003417D3C7